MDGGKAPGEARKMMSARDATIQALDEARRTTEDLRGSIDKARSRGFSPRHYFPVERATFRLPRAVPFSS
jgi:hypothetical protein